jgi:predicted nucleic acid-binding protein
MSDAFDADVLINAIDHDPRWDPCRRALAESRARIGSVVLLPEVLIKPVRLGVEDELKLLTEILATFDLKPVDEETADASVTLGAKYRLKAPDAIHLATAVVWGAERFYTRNTKAFGPHITEIDVIAP